MNDVLHFYKLYQQTIKEAFSKILLIFQNNNYFPTKDIYIELALSNYSKEYLTKIEELSRNNYANIPLVVQERQLEKEIRKLPMEVLLKGKNAKGFIVYGDPGSGKSTLLKTIVYRSAVKEKKYPKYLFL